MAWLRQAAGRRRSERGAELIEFALVFPLMLLVMVGIIDFGLMFQRYHVVTNAAREGARLAALPGYGVADVQARVNQFLTASGLTAPAVTTVLPTQSIAVGAQWICVRPVTVQYPYSYSAVGTLASYFGGAGFSRMGLQATATMRGELAAVPGCP
jgi:Flp pilus assembly protein TadG